MESNTVHGCTTSCIARRSRGPRELGRGRGIFESPPREESAHARRRHAEKRQRFWLANPYMRGRFAFTRSRGALNLRTSATGPFWCEKCAKRINATRKRMRAFDCLCKMCINYPQRKQACAS